MVEHEQIKNLMTAWIQENKISGAVVLVRKNGKIVCDAQYGYADIERKIEMKKNSIFRLASMTKPIISICMMKLEEEGKICIKDPIAKYLPVFEKLHTANKKTVKGNQIERSVTIEDILRHCSGMGCEQETVGEYESKLRRGQSLEERMSLIADIALDYQPGEVTRYSAVMAYEFVKKDRFSLMICVQASFLIKDRKNKVGMNRVFWKKGGMSQFL